MKPSECSTIFVTSYLIAEISIFKQNMYMPGFNKFSFVVEM